MNARIYSPRFPGLLISGLLLTLAAVWAAGADVPAASTKGYIFTETNGIAGNLVYAYSRSSGGPLKFLESASTQGTGTGGDLKSQGAIAITPNHKFLYAVDAGSNEITAFSFGSGVLKFINKVSSGGSQPSSLTIHGNSLFVLNSLGTPNIAGFSIGANGALSPVPGASSSLSGVGVEPAQLSFNATGTLLVVSETSGNNIDTYTLSGGIPSAPFIQPSNGPGPYGFGFDNHGFLIVSEVRNSAVSSYSVSPSGALSVITDSLVDYGGAACWIVNTNNKSFPTQYSYTTNTGSNSISGFQIHSDGSLTLLNSDGVTVQLPSNSKPLDMVLDSRSNYLYVLNQRGGNITGFKINTDGSLSQSTVVTGLPKGGTAGLAGF